MGQLNGYDTAQVQSTLDLSKKSLTPYTSANKPTPASFGTGPIWIDGVQYWSDGVSFTRKGAPDFGGKGVLIIGGDHPTRQWYGAVSGADDGMAAMYLDRGIKPYMAINTNPLGDNSPGVGPHLTYSQIATLQKNGVDIVNHGYSHIQGWQGINAGIEAQYIGVGATATIEITATNIIGLVNGSAADTDSFNYLLSNTAQNTLGKIVTAINGLTNWTCALPAFLLGTENSQHLMPIAARTAKTLPLRVAASGGLWFSYIGNKYSRVVVEKTTVYIRLYVDGSAIYFTNTTGKTISAVKAEIDALAIPKLTVSLTDNNGFSNYNYFSGQELAVTLPEGVVDLSVDVSRLSGGLSREYIIDRLIQKSVEIATANGVSLKQFAQSGGEFYHMHYNTNHSVYRGNNIFPMNLPIPQNTDSLNQNSVFLHTVTNMYNDAQLNAVVNALAKSPGHLVCLLVHEVSVDGSSGYPLQQPLAAADATEAGLNSLILNAKSNIDSGKLENITIDELALYKHSIPKPVNYIFNSDFVNSGETLTGANADKMVPGWKLINFGGVNTTHTVSGTEMAVTTDSINIATVVTQNVLLSKGKIYEVGVQVDVDSITAGNGVFFQVSSSRMWDGGKHGVNAYQSQTIKEKSGILREVIQMPADVNNKAKMYSKTAGPFNLSGGTDIKISFDNGALVIVNLSLGAANLAAVTTQEIANNINTAFTNDNNYGKEFSNIASEDGGYLVITHPYAPLTTKSTFILANGGGASNANGIVFHDLYNNKALSFRSSVANIGAVPLIFGIYSNMVGSFRLRSPYIQELRNG